MTDCHRMNDELDANFTRGKIIGYSGCTHQHGRKHSVKLRISILVLIACLALNLPAFGWNDFGHMTVACICYQHLTPAAQHRANELIKLNPLYSEWAQKVSRSNEGKEEQIFMLASTWPDIIWHDPSYTDDAPGSAECAQNIGYTDKHRHKPWHNADYPYSQDHTPLYPLLAPNAETQIPKLQQVLISQASDQLKSYDLCWLLHIVGDVHQPLHCCSRVTRSAPSGDGGGYLVKLTGKEQRLHLLWDAALGTDVSPESVISFVHTLGKANQKSAADLDARDWIKEGHQIAIDKVYKEPIGPSEGPYAVTDSYKRMASKIARQRALLAGERLARLLNETLK